MPALLFYRGEREILRFPLISQAVGSLWKVGRHPSNDLTLPDEEVSRFHAAIELKEEGYWLIDQSRNGTFVNGKKVREARLKDRDEVAIGAWKIRFSNGSEWGEKETAVQKSSKMTAAFCGMIGRGEPMQRVFAMVERSAPSDATVLVIGETGTGKELVARAIHERSARERKPFIALNCGAISPQLIESELFGHERGAFTGALQRHAGAFEQARGGTLFLDEIGELPLELQPKLLRVLEERRFRRVGGAEELETDVRIVAATHRNLELLSRQGKFREDLFFRLFSVPISLPPLRERGEDIGLLVDHFMEVLQSGTGRKELSPEAKKKLLGHPWRGNVRELKNVMTRSLLFAPNTTIQEKEILFLTDNAIDAKPSLENAEKEAIVASLKENSWNKTKTAKALGIAKSTLFHKIKEYKIENEAS
jgi:DNA-binding NtrC family response regulator